MKKSQFVTLIISSVFGLIFALGMCMCLLPEWGAFVPGVVMTAIGGVALLIMGLVAFFKNFKSRRPINWKLVGKITFGVVASLVLGLGMCMIMVWNLMVPGIIVGILGLIMLLFLIPMFLGFKEENGKAPEAESQKS